MFPEDRDIIYDVQFHFPEKENLMIKHEKINIQKNHNGGLKYINSQPHISLANFVVSSSRSEKIIDKLKDVLNQFTAIEVNFNSYGCFDTNHLIYSKVEPESKFKPFLKALEVFKTKNKFPNKHFTLFNHIHATIVIPLEKSNYELLATEYKLKNLHSIFVLDKIIIRKTLDTIGKYGFDVITLNH